MTRDNASHRPGDVSRRRFFFVSGAAAAAGVVAARAAPAIAGDAAGKLRLALIGVGGRGSRHLREILADTTHVNVVGICDIDAEPARRAAESVEKVTGSRPRVYADHRKLLEDSSIAAVFSATPCDQHFGIYMDCIAAGKHLYGEKPMGLSIGEVNAIVAAQEKHPDVKVQIGFQRRSNPRFIEGVKLVREDRVLGPILEGRAAYNNSWTPQRGLGPPGDWKSLRARSGDWMLEQAVHAWDVLNWAMGTTPVRAFGLGNHEVFRQNDPERDVTDLYTAILEYPGNVIVQFSHSWLSPRDAAFDGSYVRLVGLLGGIDLGAGRILYGKRSGRDGEEQRIQENLPGDTSLAIGGFIDAILYDRKPHSTVYNGRDATLVGLLVRKAVYERRSVTWDEMLKIR